jgi:DNA helicase-2/ATP-dependent DNA helicase PcrA
VTNKIWELIQEKVPPQEIAILYRSNYLSREYEAALITKGIAYTIYNGFEFYGRREIKDAISLLKIMYNSEDEIAWLRVLSNLEAVGEKTIAKIQKLPGSTLEEKIKFASMEASKITKSVREKIENLLFHLNQAKNRTLIFEKLTYLVDSLEYFKLWDDGNLEDRIENYQELLRSIEAFDQENLKLEEFLENVSLLSKQDEVFGIKNKIKLMTMHSSKGLEFEHVFIINAVDGVIPSARSLEEGDIEEERRLMYVAMTRAKKHLNITYSPIFNFDNYFINISRFIYESKLLFQS